LKNKFAVFLLPLVLFCHICGIIGKKVASCNKVFNPNFSGYFFKEVFSLVGYPGSGLIRTDEVFYHNIDQKHK